MGPGGGPLMMVKDSLFPLISNVSGTQCGAGRGPTDDSEGFSDCSGRILRFC